MTRKIYKSAMGKDVDIGALILQNEQTRAVGNMNVNARGDLLDSANRVIDQKNRQVQRQYKTQTNVSSDVPGTSSRAARQADNLAPDPIKIEDLDAIETVETVSPPAEAIVDTPPKQEIPRGGLAGAIARSRTIKQEKEKTLRELSQQNGIRKI